MEDLITVKVVHRPSHKCLDVLQMDLLDQSQMKYDEIEYDQINDYFDLDRIQRYVGLEENHPWNKINRKFNWRKCVEREDKQWHGSRKGWPFVRLESHTFCYLGRCRLDQTSNPTLGSEYIIIDANLEFCSQVDLNVTSQRSEGYQSLSVF